MTARARSAELKVAIACGYHGATRGQVMARLARLRALGLVLVVCTEVTRDQAPAFRTPGWRSFRVGEIVITWATGTFKGLGGWARVLSAIVYFTGKGGRKDGYRAATAKLRHRTTRVVVRPRGEHTPASVQHGHDWSDKGPRVNAHVEGDRRRGHTNRRNKRRHPGWVLLELSDENLDMFVEKWRTYLEHQLDLDCVWSQHEATRGDHGDRLISGIFAGSGTPGTVKVLDADVLPRTDADKGFDHLVAVARIRITAPSKENR